MILRTISALFFIYRMCLKLTTPEQCIFHRSISAVRTSVEHNYKGLNIIGLAKTSHVPLKCGRHQSLYFTRCPPWYRNFTNVFMEGEDIVAVECSAPTVWRNTLQLTFKYDLKQWVVARSKSPKAVRRFARAAFGDFCSAPHKNLLELIDKGHHQFELEVTLETRLNSSYHLLLSLLAA